MLHLKKFLQATALLAAAAPLFAAPVRAADGDDFNDNVKSTTKWGNDVTFGRGTLTEKNGRLEYTRPSAGLTVEDSANRPWKLTRFPYHADWEIQIDVHNSTVAATTLAVSSFGIDLLSPHADEGIYNELYGSALGSLPMRFGFSARVETAGVDQGGVDSTDQVAISQAAVRLAFDSTTKIITAHYKTNNLPGDEWVQYGSFGIAGSGGTNLTTDWHLTDTDQFTAYIYGYSSAMIVTSGQLYGDNFLQSGGVPPSGAAAPSPTGGFRFGFPTNNPFLTRMVSVSGNYSGAFGGRAYDVDVAQDESGKVMALGTADGVLDRKGQPEIALSVGTIKTVNETPTGLLKTAFKGSVDGTNTSVNVSGRGAIEAVDLGGGTNGVAGTATVKGKFGNQPFTARNVPVQLPLPEGAAENVRQDWSLQLDLNARVIKGRERIVAAARLHLPDGDAIAFPEKIVRYSVKKGYTLAFSRGTNVTAVPSFRTKKTSISIKGLTFVASGPDWNPTGGVITYQFLGQRGTENLLDFVTP